MPARKLPSPEEVRRLYWDERMTAPEIGARFGVRSGAVISYMQDHNIPRRPRSEAVKLGIQANSYKPRKPKASPKSQQVEFDCEVCGKLCQRRIFACQKIPKVCSWACRDEKQRRQKPVTKEWLEQKYLAEKLTCPDIAKLIHRDAKSVYNWLRDFGIPTRGRGTTSNPAVQFQKGHKLGVGRKMSEAQKQQIREARKLTPNLPHLTGRGVHWLKGKRGAETPNWKGGLTPERQKLYDTPEWRDVAKLVWRRDCGTCQRCGVKAKEVQLDIHHIVGFEIEELRSDLDNLVLLCDPCHGWVHSRKNVKKEFRG